MKCNWCAGDGWYVDHSSECDGFSGKECNCSGVQVQCEKCQGTGEVKDE